MNKVSAPIVFSCFVSQTDVSLDNLSQQPPFGLGENSRVRWAGLQGGWEEQEGRRVVWISACPQQQCVHKPAVQLVWVNVSVYASILQGQNL